MRWLCRPCLALLVLAAVPEVVLAEASIAALSLFGDARAGLAGQWASGADGAGAPEVLPVLRVRPGLDLAVSPAIALRFRLAGLVSHGMQGLHFDLEGPVTPGIFGIDSAYVQWEPSELLQVKVGRFQAAFELDSVVEDSLSRHDSGGFAVDWTDGLHVEFGGPKAVRIHYIGQVNRRDRSTNGVGARGPVTFDRGASRITHFMGVQIAPAGSVTQAMVDVTWIPGSVSDMPLANGSTRDLLSFSARLAADYRISERRVIHPALEIGWMPEPPSWESLGWSGRSGYAQGLAVVAGLDVRPLGRGALGLQLARVPAGFIASPDYPSNTRSAELRYSWWPIESRLKVDLRYRFREEMQRPFALGSRRTAHNLLLRATLRF